MSDFHPFGKIINKRFAELSKNATLFVVEFDGDSLWTQYLAAYPEGTNPLFRKRTEHDCACCRRVVKNLGNVVAVKDGKLVSMWSGAESIEYPYNEVAAKLDAIVTGRSIVNIFRTSEKKYGEEVTRELLEDKSVRRWNHFFCDVPSPHFTALVGKERGQYWSAADVFKRALEGYDHNHVETILELAKVKHGFYKNEEKLPIIQAFYDAQKEYKTLNHVQQNIFVWTKAQTPAAYLPGDVTSTMIDDLMKGKSLENAVKAFEVKTAPGNYRRTTAIISPTMVKNAMAVIAQQGLEESLARRFAKISDVNINNVLWVDNSVKGAMKGGLMDMLMDAATQNVPADTQAVDIGIEEFMKEILPQAKSMDVLLKNEHMTNFVSLTAPQIPDAAQLFSWNNGFGWSYDGNITDSIKERVKAAGGNVNAKLRFSLSWFNYDDLDLHVYEPTGGHIYFGNPKSYKTDGFLDVDMNRGSGTTRTPVENIAWNRPADGVYCIDVNNWHQRETNNVGCVVEVESEGQVTQYSHPKPIGQTKTIRIANVTVKNGVVVEMKPGHPDVTGQGISQEKWGVKTEQYTKIATVMYSPNYWDNNAVGNKHWFFILDGCKNPEPARGIYNEFLKQELNEHRKVFEVLGDKTKCLPTAEQLSGVGFSSTKPASVTIRVKGAKLHRSYNVKF